ncbi:hypothetical protein PV768_16755 [Pseudarthrobacter sp. CC4]|uniref:hypothetical protein n=1 Tax=Pseudarthrobacter TaxID=1742993 RepID=UPI002AA6C440|nr:hypothetical protein [Pseudarthrobacter oxydans]WPU07777.1 hypothetical protein SMD14_11285 [Pseudarthrobacter oxydans]
MSHRTPDSGNSIVHEWRARLRGWDPERKTLVVISLVLFGLFLFTTIGWISGARPAGPAWDAMGTWAGVIVTGLGFAWAVFTFKNDQRLRYEQEQVERLRHAQAVAVVSTASSTPDDDPVTGSTDQPPSKSWTTRFQWTVQNAGPFPIFQLIVFVPHLAVSGEASGQHKQFSMGNVLPGGSADGSSSQCIAKRGSLDGFDVVNFAFTDVWGTRWKGNAGQPVARLLADE